MIDETSGIIGWPIGQQYRERAARDEASSTTTWKSLVQNYKTRAVRDGARIDELRQSTNHWHDTAQMLKRQRDTAEEERDEWKVRAKTVEEQREAARDEADRWKDKWVVAEEERDEWKIEAMQSSQQRQSLRDLLIIAEGQRDGARAQVKEMKQRLDEWVRWGDRMASGHPDAPMASLDHEVRAVIANRYGMSTITAALAVQPSTGDTNE